MSTVTRTSDNATIQEQSVQATAKIKNALGLGVLTPAELKRLSAALSIAAADELISNTLFAARVRNLFEESAPKKPQVKGKRRSASDVIQGNDLTPIATGINYEFDPFAPPDPYFLVRLYGVNQLPKALNRYTPTRLKEAVKKLALHEPSIKAKSKATKSELIDLITRQFTN